MRINLINILLIRTRGGQLATPNKIIDLYLFLSIYLHLSIYLFLSLGFYLSDSVCATVSISALPLLALFSKCIKLSVSICPISS